jgi:hypothetical protein
VHAARAPASMTSSTGIPAARRCTTSAATAAMVLHAMISIFTSRWSRNSVICAVKCSMVATDFTP